MNVVDIKRQVRKRFGDPGGVMIKDQDIYDFINDAQLQIARQTETMTSTSSSTGAAMPYTGVDIVEYRFVTYNNRPLVFTTQDDLLAKGLDLTYRASPDYWYALENSNTISTYPLPPVADTTPMAISYVRKPADIVADGTALEIRNIYHNDIVNFCIARCHELQQNWQAAQMAMSEFTNGLAQSRYEGLSADDGYSVVRDDPWDTSVSIGDYWV